MEVLRRRHRRQRHAAWTTRSRATTTTRTAQKFTLHVAKSPATDQAHQIGSLFMNFGGPGAPMAIYLEVVRRRPVPRAQQALRHHRRRPARRRREPTLDRLQGQPGDDRASTRSRSRRRSRPTRTSWSPRTTATSRSCLQNNPGVLPYVSTANVARDFDNVRDALGEKKLNYFGFSYGTFLGATYASLFPKNYRSMVLDGPVDATRYINDPLEDLSTQTAGFEKALGPLPRRLHGAIRRRAAGFGGADPEATYDDTRSTRLDRPDPGRRLHGRSAPDHGDDLRGAALSELYNKAFWPEFAQCARGRPERRRLRHPPDRRRGLLRSQPRRVVRSGRRPLLHDRRGRAELPAQLDPYMHAGEQAWDQFHALLAQQRLRRAQLRALSGQGEGRVRRPVQGARTRRRRRSWSRPRTTRRRRTAARCGWSPTSATRGC